MWSRMLVLVWAVWAPSWTRCCRCWLLGYTGMAAGLSWSWSAVDASCCAVVLWYLPGRCCEETKSDLGRLSEVSPEKSWLNVMAALMGLVGCAWFVAVIGWIPRHLLWLVVRIQSQIWLFCLVVRKQTMLREEERNTSLPGLGQPTADLIFGYCLLCLYSIHFCYTAGQSELFMYTGSSFIKYK